VKIADVEWIGAAQAEKLKAMGVVHDDDLISRGSTRAGRSEIAMATGIGEQMILDWLCRLELLRIDGVSPVDVTLLRAAGVSGVTDLARRDPHRLAATLAELGRTRAIARQLPDAAVVASWVHAARTGDVVQD
jgi:nucleotidyltransferase/DNA polymerase involved in DNA repair